MNWPGRKRRIERASPNLVLAAPQAPSMAPDNIGDHVVGVLPAAQTVRDGAAVERL
jgi:hypothetical protein